MASDVDHDVMRKLPDSIFNVLPVFIFRREFQTYVGHIFHKVDILLFMETMQFGIEVG